MNPKGEFIADLLINVLMTEPNIPLYLGFLVSEVTGQKEPLVKTYEIADPAYARQKVSLTPITDGFVHMLHDIQFPRAAKRWEKITHYAIFDAPKDGNMLLLRTTGGVSTIDSGEIVSILAAEFQLYVGHNHYSYFEIAI